LNHQSDSSESYVIPSPAMEIEEYLEESEAFERQEEVRVEMLKR